MKILLVQWGAFNENILKSKLEKLGLDVTVYEAKCDDYMFDGKVAQDLLFLIHEEKSRAVISYDYLPVLSLVCDAAGIDYYSWGYDTPQMSLFAKTVLYPCNHIGLFDRRQAEFFKEIGYGDVYHVPLAVDPVIFEKTLSGNCPRLDQMKDKGFSDVAFVGSLYTDARKNNLYQSFRTEALSQQKDLKNWAEMDELVKSYCFDYKRDLIRQDMSGITEFLKPYMMEARMGLGNNYFEVDEIITREDILEKQITAEERRILMTSIADHCKEKEKDFALYTRSDTSCLGNLNDCNRGPVDYKAEMPFVFRRSRINLHITLRSIHTGIPLRVLDVLACGGFLLSNAQEEILENFEDGVHLATYSTPEECLEKIDYYLKHEDERVKIALAGRKRVEEVFSYENALKKLLKLQ